MSRHPFQPAVIQLFSGAELLHLPQLCRFQLQPLVEPQPSQT
jgi:hypothetical protein